jgi:hypothetical protein
MKNKSTPKSISSHERIRLDRERRLQLLEKDLILAAGQPTTALDMTEVQKKGLLTVLRGLRPVNSRPTVRH